jgi:hypothetical protein
LLVSARLPPRKSLGNQLSGPLDCLLLRDLLLSLVNPLQLGDLLLSCLQLSLVGCLLLGCVGCLLMSGLALLHGIVSRLCVSRLQLSRLQLLGCVRRLLGVEICLVLLHGMLDQRLMVHLLRTLVECRVADGCLMLELRQVLQMELVLPLLLDRLLMNHLLLDRMRMNGWVNGRMRMMSDLG